MHQCPYDEDATCVDALTAPEDCWEDRDKRDKRCETYIIYQQKEHIRTLETMTKKITHCPDCGSTWYDDGFTAECPQCRIRRLEEENRNHKQTLAGIAAMNPVKEGDRAIQWAKDGLSGYTMSADATIKGLQDKVRTLEAELTETQNARADLVRKVEEVAKEAEENMAQELYYPGWIQWKEHVKRLRNIVKEGSRE